MPAVKAATISWKMHQNASFPHHNPASYIWGRVSTKCRLLCNIRLCDIPIIGLHWCIVSYTVAIQKIYYQEGYMGRIVTDNRVVGVYPISKEHCWKHACIGSFSFLRYCRILELSADIYHKSLDLFEQEKFVSTKFKMTAAVDSFDHNPSSSTRTGSYHGYHHIPFLDCCAWKCLVCLLHTLQ